MGNSCQRSSHRAAPWEHHHRLLFSPILLSIHPKCSRSKVPPVPSHPCGHQGTAQSIPSSGHHPRAAHPLGYGSKDSRAVVASASLGCAQELLQPVAGAGTRGGTGSMAQAPMVACKSTRSAAQAPTAACRGTGSDPGLRGTPVPPTLQLLLLIVNVRCAAAGGRFVVSVGSQYGVRRGAGRKGGTLASLPPVCRALQLCLFRAHLPTAQAAF